MAAAPTVSWRRAPSQAIEHVAHERMRAMLADRLGTDPATLSSLSLIEILDRHAARAPNRVAVIGTTEQIGRAELMARVHRLARTIAQCVPSDGSVAVLLPDGPDALVAVLSCVAAGRLALILNAAHPAARNAAILEDARASSVLLREVPAGLALREGIVILSPNQAPGDGPLDGDRPPAPLPATAPAFVIYTSGSTGQPKGIVLSQAMSIYRAMTYLIVPDQEAPSRTISLFALAAVTGLHGVLSALIGGGCAVMAGDSPPLPLMVAERATRLIVLPALLRVLLQARDSAPAFSNLAMLCVAGDASSGREIAEWYERLPPTATLQATYGQTESTIATWFVPRDFAEPGALPVGFVRPGLDYAVLDPQGCPVPDGEPGSLHVRSRFVALGEWIGGQCVPGRMRPDGEDSDRRILDTGDIVIARPDGMLGFGGRADRQVKVRGLRIEPTEIEAALRCVPGVLDAAVIARPRGSETELLGFVVEETAGTIARALAHLSATLPPQMRPRRLIAVPALPRLPGGKVDQMALLALAG